MPEEYLWDRSGPVDPELKQLEDQLGSYRRQKRARKPPARIWIPLALAACLAIGAFTLFTLRPETLTDWTMDARSLPLHRVIEIQQESTVQVSTIGRLTFKPGSRFRIVKSEEKNQVLELLEGSFNALIVSDPYVFQVITPPAHLDDLGCAYDVTVHPNGNGIIAVNVGWVRVKAQNEDSLVQQGYEVDLVKGKAPSIPRRSGNAEASGTLALVHLLWRAPTPEARGAAFDKLAAAFPPPPGVTRERALKADRTLVRDYWPALDLGHSIQLPRIFNGE